MNNFAEYDDIVVHLKKITGHLGADVAIDAVGAEADGSLLQHVTATKLKLLRARIPGWGADLDPWLLAGGLAWRLARRLRRRRS